MKLDDIIIALVIRQSSMAQNIPPHDDAWQIWLILRNQLSTVLFTIFQLFRLQRMSTRYEQEQFELEDPQPSNNKRNNKKQTERSLITISNSMTASKMPSIKNKTIDVGQNITNKHPNKHAKSISVNSNQSGPTLPSTNKQTRAASLNNQLKQTESQNFGKIGKSKIISQSRPSFKRTLKAANFGEQRNSDKEPYQNEKSSQKMSLLTINNKKRLQLSLVERSESAKVNQYFCHSREQLQLLSTDQVNRLTNKIKEWIIKLDGFLSDRITKAIKEKSNQQSEQSVTERLVALLKANIANNQQVIRSISIQFSKLQGQQGEIKEEEYELLLDKQADRLNELIKDKKRHIIQLKKQVKLEENRRNSQQDNSKHQKKFDFLKFDILQNRRDEAKNAVTVDKTQARLQQVSELLQETSNRYQELLREAEEKNISKEFPHIQTKHNELTAKIQKLRALKATSESYINRSIAKLVNDNKNLVNQLRQYDEDIKHNEQKIDKSTQQALQLLDKHKAKLSKKNRFNLLCNFFNSIKGSQQDKPINRNPFAKDAQQEHYKQQLKQIRQSDEAVTNLRQTQYENEFMAVSNEFLSVNSLKIDENKQASQLMVNTHIQDIDRDTRQKQIKPQKQHFKMQVQKEEEKTSLAPKRFQLRKVKDKKESENKLII